MKFKAIYTRKTWVSTADRSFDGVSTPGMGLSTKPNTIALCKWANSKSSTALAYKNLTWDSNSSSTSFIHSANFSTTALKLSWFTYALKLLFSKTNSST